MGGLKRLRGRRAGNLRSEDDGSFGIVAGGGTVARRMAVRRWALANRLEASVLLFAAEPIYETDSAELRHEKQAQVDHVLRQLAAGKDTTPTGIELFWDYCQNARELGFQAFDEPDYYLSLTVDPHTGKVA